MEYTDNSVINMNIQQSPQQQVSVGPHIPLMSGSVLPSFHNQPPSTFPSPFVPITTQMDTHMSIDPQQPFCESRCLICQHAINCFFLSVHPNFQQVSASVPVPVTPNRPANFAPLPKLPSEYFCSEIQLVLFFWII